MPRSHYNSIQFNSGHYNGGIIGESATYSTDLVVFDSFSLADNSNIFVTDLLDSAPERQLLEGEIPRDDGEYINGDYWRRKFIEVKGFIKQDTLTDLEEFM